MHIKLQNVGGSYGFASACKSNYSLELVFDGGSANCTMLNASDPRCLLDETNVGGYVWEHCPQECTDASFCPLLEAPLCDSYPSLSIYYWNWRQNVTKCKQCSEMAYYRKRCTYPTNYTAAIVQSGYVWQHCQKECFILSGCPFLQHCSNKLNAKVTFNLAGTATEATCKWVYENNPNDICPLEEKEIGDFV
jgi:hypothetical protein